MGEYDFIANGLYIFMVLGFLAVFIIPASQWYDATYRLPKCEHACVDAYMTYDRYAQVALGPGRCWCDDAAGKPMEIPFE